jgi:hypothetical protein
MAITPAQLAATSTGGTREHPDMLTFVPLPVRAPGLNPVGGMRANMKWPRQPRCLHRLPVSRHRPAMAGFGRQLTLHLERNCFQPVTNQVTTAPGNGRRRAMYSETDIHPTCGNRTQTDDIGQNRHAW